MPFEEEQIQCVLTEHRAQRVRVVFDMTSSIDAIALWDSTAHHRYDTALETLLGRHRVLPWISNACPKTTPVGIVDRSKDIADAILHTV